MMFGTARGLDVGAVGVLVGVPARAPVFEPVFEPALAAVLGPAPVAALGLWAFAEPLLACDVWLDFFFVFIIVFC